MGRRKGVWEEERGVGGGKGCGRRKGVWGGGKGVGRRKGVWGGGKGCGEEERGVGRRKGVWEEERVWSGEEERGVEGGSEAPLSDYCNFSGQGRWVGGGALSKTSLMGLTSFL